MHRDNWDDLRFVLAVADTGSVSGAARMLGVNHATVIRRVAVFEERHGIALFDRAATGYTLLADRARLIDAAREAEAAHLAVARLVAGGRAPLQGAVRITSTDTLSITLLPSALAALRAAEPGLRLELLASNAHADLSRVEADIAVRPAAALSDDLRGEIVAELGFAAYAARGCEESPLWLGLLGPLQRSRAAEWMARAVPGEAIAGAADSFVTLREMAASGQGKAVLPCILGDGDARLSRLPGAIPDISVPVWIATHADLADAPRLTVVRSRLAAALKAEAARLRG
jgi:DNA-binding transcriptional LysR family regulator